LPGVITFTDGNTITYGYDAAGSKLSVAYTAGGSTVKTEYAGNKVYKNGTLSMILTQEGYLTLAGTTPTYYYYLKDHQGNNRVVINQSGAVQQVNHYYPFGGLFGEGIQTANQPYKYNGKKLDRFQGVDMYDYGARHYDAALGRWFTVDPMAEKYYSFSQYVYCANNPVRFIDPNGKEIDLSGMSEEERKRYESQIATQRENSKLFNAMYSSLENSKEVYVTQYGKTTTIEGTSEAVEGQFIPNKDGGGTVTFSDAITDIKGGTLSEELFHAYQHDNKANYAKGEFNVEFEAKMAVTAIGNEYGGFGAISGAEGFQNKISYGDYGNNTMIITPTSVISSRFNSDYISAANSYSKYNRDNNIGNSHYRTNTTVAPFSLQQMIIKAYGK